MSLQPQVSNTAEHSIYETNETIEGYFKKNAFFPIFDVILINLEKKFFS